MEDSGIAWPNPAMWCQMPHRFYSTSPPRKAKAKTRDPDAHGHSPAHHVVKKEVICTPSNTARPASTSTHELMHSPAQGAPELHFELEDPCWARMPLLPDPFVDDSRYRVRKRLIGGSASDHQSVTDQSLTDSHPVVPAHDDDQSQTTTDGAAQDTSPIPESQFDELMASYSPRKNTSSGTLASANLKVACTAPIQTRFMAASELKTHSYTDEELRSTAPATSDCRLTDVQIDPDSDSGKRSAVSNHSFGKSELPGTTIRDCMAKDIKSKKENNLKLKSDNKMRKQPLASDHGKEIESGDANDPFVVGESKRKRVSTNPKPRQVTASSDSNCSPTRKVSRVGWNGGLDECAGGVMRVRLGSRDNNVGRW